NLKSKAKFKTFALRNRKADLYFENINQAVNFKLGYQFKLNLFSKKFDFPYFGLFNLQNLLGAFSLCLEFLSSKDLENIYDPQILKFPDFRSQVFKTGDKIFVIDCYNANPGSFRTAIHEVLKLRVSLYKNYTLFGIFADMAELGSKAKFYHLKLAKLAAKTDFRTILYIGDYCDIFKQALGKKVKCFSSDSELFSEAARQMRSKKNLIVLVKGSHKFALERVIEYIKNSH
ncbi:MAG: hypothetical protein NZO16_08020, partial [Deltaproteobacteria bacterium]|nr:hypothetical protein [Deltaproteobacteria bacterium]